MGHLLENGPVIERAVEMINGDDAGWILIYRPVVSRIS